MYVYSQIETKKLEIETNLSTNLLRREQELEAGKSSAESEALSAEIDSKEKELDEAKSLVDETTEELKSEPWIVIWIACLVFVF